jgi:pentose-5-phosphate-3-epimerase
MSWKEWVRTAEVEPSIYAAGANLFVAGSGIFGREDFVRAYRRLVAALA